MQEGTAAREWPGGWDQIEEMEAGRPGEADRGVGDRRVAGAGVDLGRRPHAWGLGGSGRYWGLGSVDLRRSMPGGSIHSVL